jgi:4-amino-4-deoxy-L-arabinose transferase-like glycosyltransferase
LSIAFLTLLSSFLFFHRLADRDLWSSHEARAAQNAQRMLDDGDWLLPRLFDGQLDLQKPPLYYWLVAAIGRMQGGKVDALAVRLPASLSATLVVFAVWWTLNKRGRPLAGIIAAIALATSQHFTWLARTGRIDMVLTFTVTAAILILTFWRRGHILAYVVIVAGLLLKGPIGLVLPLAVVLSQAAVGKWFLREPAAQARDEVPSLACAAGSLLVIARSLRWGIPLALLLAAPWFLIANEQTRGEFFRVFFLHHNIDRALGTSDELAVHPWWFYGPRWLADVLPWSPLFLIGWFWFVFAKLWQRDAEARCGLIWMLAVTLVLSCAQFKRADYLLPAYPGFAIFMGCLAERAWQQFGTNLRRVAACGFAAILIAIVGFWLFMLHYQIPRNESFHEQQSFAQEIRRQAPARQTVLFFRVEAHALAFHLGRPLNTFLEWENLDVWAGRPGVHYIVMSPESAAEWPEHVHAGTLEEVCRNTDWSGGRHEKPLVLMRTRPKAEAHAASRQ